MQGQSSSLLDFGHKLLEYGRELYRSNSGSVAVNEEIKLITADLTGLVQNLRSSLESSCSSASGRAHNAGPGKDGSNTTLEALCDKAATLAEELSARLDKLRPQGAKARKWKTIQQVVKNAWSRDEIVDLNRRLAAFKDVLEFNLLVSLR